MPTIDVETLQTWLAQRRPLAVLDVRTAADRAEWAIAGSLHIDAYAALKANDPHALDGVDLPADIPIVTVCGAGKMSLVAAELLRARNVPAYSLVGGMQAWSLAWNTAEVPSLQMPEPVFVAEVLSRIPPTPPNHHTIVALNEAGAAPPADPATLEAGANRCAVA